MDPRVQGGSSEGILLPCTGDTISFPALEHCAEWLDSRIEEPHSVAG
jgi:hypothetical protein